MTLFRPCIDLHQGKVKQIVGETLGKDDRRVVAHFVSAYPPCYFAARYRQDGLKGGHVIQLGPGNEAAAIEALQAYPDGLQVGGRIHAENADAYLDAGASHIIVTSPLFDKSGQFREEKLQALATKIGKKRLVIDLSCRVVDSQWRVTMNRWQTVTDLEIGHETLDRLAVYCDEFLIHAVDVEGKCQGIDTALVAFLGTWGQLPITYAGGACSIVDLTRVHELSHGRVDLAIGSALDLFGGTLIRYQDCVAFNRKMKTREP